MDTIYITALGHKGNLRLVVEVDVPTSFTWDGLERPEQKDMKRDLPRKYAVRGKYARAEEEYEFTFDIDSNKALEWVMMVRTDKHSYRVGYYFTNMFLACGLPSGLQLTKAGITEINQSLETILAHHEWILKGHVNDAYMEYILPEELR